MVWGENEYGICKIPSGPMLNLFLFSNSEKILGSSVSMCTDTLDPSLNGFLNVSIDEVLLPTAVEIGYGSIIVGINPFPSMLNSHLPTYGFSIMIYPLSTTSKLLGEY